MGDAKKGIRHAVALAAVALAATAGSFVACGGDDSSSDNSTSDAGGSDGGGSDATITDANGGNDGAITCSVTPCAKALGVGGGHTCALTDQGVLYCWGLNAKGAAGVGVVDGGAVDPQVVTAPTKIDAGAVASLAAGGFGSIPALDDDFTCATSSAGAVSCWGSNYYLALGRGDDGGTPFDPGAAPVSISSVAQLSAGFEIACAVTTAGGISCWGTNDVAQLVDPIAKSSVPHAIPLGGTTFTSVSVGDLATCALSTDSHVWCWGNNAFDVLGRAPTDGGIGDRAPAQVAGLSDIAEVAVGEYTACALSKSGAVSCWGAAGALGRGDVDSGASDPNPAAVATSGGTTFVHIVAGAGMFCALDTTGGAWCWGNNTLGSTGTGTIVDAGTGTVKGVPSTVTAPAHVALSGPVSVIATGSGAGHVCVILQTGAVQCWGANAYDQLGSATTYPLMSITPVDVHLE